MSLEEELKGVNPVSPPEPEEPTKVEPPEKEGEGEGRTLDNVRGEFARKFGETDAKLDAVLGRIDAMQADIAGRNQPSPDKPAGTPGGNPLDSYSIDQLQAAVVNDQVDDATKQSITAYLPVRAARDEATRIGKENRQSDVMVREQEKANQTAVDRYPDLADPATPMHKEVNRILLARGSQPTNPNAVLDAANEAASRLGVNVTEATRRPRVPGKPLGGAAPVGDVNGEEYEGMSDEEIAEIAPGLQHLLGRNKDGTPKVFDTKFIKERSKLYKDRY